MMAPLISALAVALAVALVIGLGSQAVRLRRSRRGSSLVWSMVALAPAAAGVLTLLALLTPHPFSTGCHCNAHGGHHPHLCWLHPTFAEPLLIPASICLGVWLALTLKGSVRELVQLARTSRRLRDLDALPVVEIDGVSVRLADCGGKVAFTAGLLRPKIILDRALFAVLSPQERRALVHHEAGHVERRDPFTFAVLRFVTRTLSPFGGAWLLRRWRLAAEVECDQRAALRIGSASDVAATLVKVARFHVPDSRVEPPFALGISGSDLRTRVVSLLDGRPKARAPSNDVLGLLIAGIGIAILVACWPGDAVHHIAETLLGFVIH